MELGKTRHSLTRRAIGAAIGVGGLTAALSACGGADGGSGGQSAAPTTASAAKPADTKPVAASQPVALTAAYWSSSPEDHNVFENVFKKFSTIDQNVKVTFDDIPADQFVQKITTMFAAGTPPDTMELHPAWVLEFINAKRLTDLSDRAKDHKALYIPAQLDFWTSKGKIYGMPYYSGPSFIMYNKSLFKKMGVKTPEDHAKEGQWTWDTLRKSALSLTGGSGADKTFGWDADPSNLQFYLSVPIWGNLGELTNKDETEWTVTTPEVTEVVQFHADMMVKDKSMPTPADVQGISWLFRTGRVGMAWAGKFRSLEVGDATFEVGMIGTPKGKVGPINRDGPNASGLPVGTKNIDTAYKLAAYMGGPEAAPVYLASGRSVPVQKELLDFDTFKKALKPWERIEVYKESINSVRAWRVPGKGAEAGRAWKAEWDRVTLGQLDVPTMLKNAKAAMDPTLKS
jgi:multiple sugar transport system substrate-binding protein